MITCLYVKENGNSTIVPFREDFITGSEGLQISETHTLFYNPSGKSNKLFSKLNYNLFGNVIIVRTDKNGKEINIEDNIRERLPKILEKDRKKRKEFISYFEMMGIPIINASK